MKRSPAQWYCCHLGAREHYAIPRALHGTGRLGMMITDAWVAPGSRWSVVPGASAQRLTERWHSELADARVCDFTGSLVAHELIWRVQVDGWQRLMKRNAWFGDRAASVIASLPDDSRSRIVFAHSYSARQALAAARSRGFMTVLGQIDPGPEHFAVAQQAAVQRPAYGRPPEQPPADYVEAWRVECELADWIVVNSEWSGELLERAGIPRHKLRVIPLAFAGVKESSVARRHYPDRFTPDRPLRLLFVGHASVVKGAAALLEAMSLLDQAPVELRMVGAIGMVVPQQLPNQKAIQWVGPVPRADVARHYRDSDLLVFPSLSDGFGMAQIEAQGHRLPILASRSCGRVVTDGVNGLLLAESSPAAIAAAVRRILSAPGLLQRFSDSSTAGDEGMSLLATSLADLERA